MPSVADLGVRALEIDRAYIAQTGEIPAGYQLIRDSMPFKVVDVIRSITESVGKKIPTMRCTGVFQRADEKNANGRVYPLSILEEAVSALQDPIKARQIMGEFDHPPDAKIHLDRISHLITRLWIENKTVYGELEVINDARCPCGSMLSCYLDRGIQVGVSSRGVGDMEIVMHEGEDTYEVQPGFRFVTFDAVAEPSVKGTQLQKLNESIQRKVNPRLLVEAREKLLIREVGRFLDI